ncbi:MAG: hypothetical protein KC619_35085 [Myxococcales bacterium]|nr:hypothetical protein [Myxococcales bacterium]
MSWQGRPFGSPELRRARERALEHVRGAHPEVSLGSAKLRAEEPDRFVFAVFYREGDQHVVPGAYRIIAVDRGEGATEELPCTPSSPYWVRGLK